MKMKGTNQCTITPISQRSNDQPEELIKSDSSNNNEGRDSGVPYLPELPRYSH